MKKAAVEKEEYELLACRINKKKRDILVGTLRFDGRTLQEFLTTVVDNYLVDKNKK